MVDLSIVFLYVYQRVYPIKWILIPFHSIKIPLDPIRWSRGRSPLVVSGCFRAEVWCCTSKTLAAARCSSCLACARRGEPGRGAAPIVPTGFQRQDAGPVGKASKCWGFPTEKYGNMVNNIWFSCENDGIWYDLTMQMVEFDGNIKGIYYISGEMDSGATKW